MTDTTTKPTKTTPAQTAEIIARAMSRLTPEWESLFYWQQRNPDVAGDLRIHAFDLAMRMEQMGYVEFRIPAGDTRRDIRKTVNGILADRPVEEEVPAEAMQHFIAWNAGRARPLTLEQFAKRLLALDGDDEYHDLAEAAFGYTYRDVCIELMICLDRGERVTCALDRLEYRVDEDCETPSDLALMDAHPVIVEALRAAKAKS